MGFASYRWAKFGVNESLITVLTTIFNMLWCYTTIYNIYCQDLLLNIYKI